MQQGDILVTSNYVTVSITLHLLVGKMITLFRVNLVAVSWVVIEFSKGPSKAPSPSNFQGAQKRSVRIVLNIGHGILLLSQTPDTNFSQVPTFILSFLKNHKERHLMLWLLLASTFSELACLWFATWGLEFYWARKASFFWTWCTKEREQLCLLSGWKYDVF